jgi:hypothetical protein
MNSERLMVLHRDGVPACPNATAQHHQQQHLCNLMLDKYLILACAHAGSS